MASAKTINPAHGFLQKTYEAFHKQEFQRQIKHRHEGKPLSIDLTHPFFMYLSLSQGRNYEAAISQPEFQANLYAPIAALYETSFRKLATEIKRPYDYVDLGPGYTSYLSIVDQFLFKRKKPRFYIPVDVNLHLLRKLCRYTHQLSVTTIPFNTLFELLPPQLDALQLANGVAPRIFNIGLTFNNYTPPKAVRLMRELLGKGDSMLLCAESPESVTLDHLLAPYKNEETEAFNRASIAPLELPTRYTKYHVEFIHGRVEMGFRISNDITLQDDSRLRPGDFLCTCISYRYRKDSLLKYLKKHFGAVSAISTTNGAKKSPHFFTLLVSSTKTYEA